MADQISSRRELSSRTRTKANDTLKKSIESWDGGKDLDQRVCVYTTGSFGRDDASRFSDLDVFIVSEEENVTQNRLLTGLEEIELLASIVHTNRELSLPDIDADGGFLKVHQLSDYLVGLGKPSDDANNTFTGRLLLLLESKPLFGHEVFEKVRRECVDRYWNDYADHSDSFLPAFLINDILRFWRTLCVNYEAGSPKDPEKRRAKNYKLKHSRLLTCFSAIVGLQAQYQKESTITPETAIETLSLTPLERLEHAKPAMHVSLHDKIGELFNLYERFLVETDCSKQELYEKMRDPGYYKESLENARVFGDTMFSLLEGMSMIETDVKAKRFFRYLTV